MRVTEIVSTFATIDYSNRSSNDAGLELKDGFNAILVRSFHSKIEPFFAQSFALQRAMRTKLMVNNPIGDGDAGQLGAVFEAGPRPGVSRRAAEVVHYRYVEDSGHRKIRKPRDCQ
jgi:hypothetical protein